ncbi:MAG: dihydroneopterin aldolase [Gammaproteobacteria bacterium]|nr:dihydroneopterin aldolase [Gammaproteobacteria bacterium]
MSARPPDLVYLRELRLAAVIGIYEWEQRVRQTISIDLEMAADIASAAASDAIEDTLNYKAIAERLSSFVEESRFKLIETLAERAADMLLTEFGIRWLKLSVSKPGAVRGAREVGVVIERSAAASS